MKIPPSGGGGQGAPSSPGQHSSGTSPGEKSTRAHPGNGAGLVPSAGSVRRPVLSSPLVRLMGSLWDLSIRSGMDEILERLADIPVQERREALFLQMLLAKKNISLTREQWEELWTQVKEKAASPADGERESLFTRRNGGEPFFSYGEEVYFRLVRDRGGRGAAVLSRDEEKGDALLLCLQKGGRTWEFRLRRDMKKRGRMDVYTDDAELIARPPRSWGEFRRAMAGYGISVEKRMKSLQEDPFFTDIGSREPDHMVDIVL